MTVTENNQQTHHFSTTQLATHTNIKYGLPTQALKSTKIQNSLSGTEK